jgi:hypothetical protein
MYFYIWIISTCFLLVVTFLITFISKKKNNDQSVIEETLPAYDISPPPYLESGTYS